MPTARVQPEHLERWCAMLGAAENGAADMAYGPSAGRSAVAAHALLRSLLETVANRPASAWVFKRAQSGRLDLERAARGRAPFFSLTHTNDFVACAASLQVPVGIDAEAARREVPDALAQTVLSPSELALLDPVSVERRTESFLRLWTLREAYVKASRQGLRFPGESFSFALDPPRIRFARGSAEDAGGWQFRNLLMSEHIVSLAIRCRQCDSLIVIERIVAPDELAFAEGRRHEAIPFPA
jgi:4'-phosphopantetheinyl transferase